MFFLCLFPKKVYNVMVGVNVKKFKVIIDTDPGVDDTNALVYVLNDPQFEIELITTAQGNIRIENATRNMLHLLDMFHKDIPVVEGYHKRLSDNTEDASFLHTFEGMGGYNPPKTTTHKALKKDCADAVYEVLKQHPKEITFVILGPHTNFAYLIQKHPDAKDLIKNVLMMGGAPYGIKSNPHHNSFNIRTDAPAFKYTIDSGLPIVMVPSSVGRDLGYFTEAQVEQIKNTNDVGKFLAKTFETYWEPNYEDRRIATNDISAIYYLTHPHLYKTKRANVEVNEQTGQTIPHNTLRGQFKIVVGMKREKFLNLLFKKLEEMSEIKLPEVYTPARMHKEKSHKQIYKQKNGKKATTKKVATKTTKTQKVAPKTTKAQKSSAAKTRKTQKAD